MSDSDEDLQCDATAKISGLHTVNYITIGNVGTLNVCDQIQTATNHPSSNDEDLTRGLKDKLKEFYNDVTLPCCSWMNDGQDLLIRDYYMQLQLENKNLGIKVDDLFSKIADVKPTRILIDGQPGFGKTTLATKLIHDWACDLNYINEFNLAFLVPLRELSGKSVQSALEAIAGFCGFEKSDDICEIISANSNKTLLILDGLDELPKMDRCEVLKILFRQIYDKMTIVVTCRTNAFDLDSKEIRNLFGGIEKKKVFYDKLVTVLGIASQNREKFVQNFVFSSSESEVALQHLRKLTLLNNAVFKSPLMLILLSYFLIVNVEVIHLTTKTEVYKTLVNFVIKRSLEKLRGNDIALEENIDIFNPSSEFEQNFVNIFSHFGDFCLGKVLEKNLQFEVNELTKNIYEMGFFVYHKNLVPFKSKNSYEAFHVSILEFAVAFALKIEFEENECKLSDNVLQKILKIYFNYANSPLILPFLFGLLGNNAHCFFLELEQHADLISTQEYIFWAVTSECEISDKLSLITSFFPPKITNSDVRLTQIYQSDLHECVLREGIRCKRIVSLHTSTNFTPKIPQDVFLPYFEFAVCAITDLNDYKVEHLINIQCDRLLFTFPNELGRVEPEIIWKFFGIFCGISANKKCLNLSQFFNRSIFSKKINDSIMQNLKLSKLMLTLTSIDDHNAELLNVLLNRNQIKSLELTLLNNFSSNDLSNIVENLSKSDYIENFDLISLDLLSIDVYVLTNGGRKCWKSLNLMSCKLYCSNALISRTSIASLKTTNGNSNLEFPISNLELQKLGCRSRVLFEIYKLDPPLKTWSNNQNLIQLILILDHAANDLNLWRNLKNFKQLEMLEIVINSDVSIESDEIVKSIQELPIRNFAIRCARSTASAFDFINRLLRRIKQSFPWNFDDLLPHPLTCVDLIIDLNLSYHLKINNYFCESVKYLLECIQKCFLQKVKITSFIDDWWYLIQKENIVNRNVFNVEYSLCNYDGDFVSSKFYQLGGNKLFTNSTYDIDSVRNCNQFSITLK